MKQTILAFVLMVTSTILVAQKVDLDRYNFRYTYRALPNNPLPDDYKTYNFNISSGSSIREVYNDDQVRATLSIDGLKREEGRAHITISVNMGEVSLKNPELKEREEIIKDKDGKETGRKKYYWIEATYSWNADAYVMDYKGTKLYSTVFGNGSGMTWKGTESENRGSVGDYYNNNKYSIRGELARQLVTDAMNGFRNTLNANYGYRTITESDILWIMDSKKHPENEGMKTAWAGFKEAMALMNEKDDLTQVKEKLVPVIQYFDSLKVRITGTEKGDKKLRYSAYYCLAKIYLLTEQPDAAIKEAELLIANDYDTNDGKYMIKLANNLKALFAKNTMKTQHFPIDISKYAAPAGN
jgi:hypothetical protein